MMKMLGTYFLLGWLLCSFQFCFGTITVDSVHVTASTCPNNGTATIHARSTNDSAVFLYNVVAGPVLYPQQNDSTFRSLYPGTYSAWVHDINSYDSTMVSFTITGGYQPPTFSPYGLAPACVGGTGSIYANFNVGTGLAPYSWQIVSPYISAPQASDAFYGVAPGTYTVKVTDGCDIVRSFTTVIGTGGTDLRMLGAQLAMTSCNTWSINTIFRSNMQPGNLYVNMTTVVNRDTIVEVLGLQGGWPYGADFVSGSISNMHFGDTLTVGITDNCGVTEFLSPVIVKPFSFHINFSAADINCNFGYTGIVSYDPVYLDNYPTSITAPLTVTLVDTLTHAVSYTYQGSCPSGCAATPIMHGGTVYQLKVNDNCGDIFQQYITWPLSDSAMVTISENPAGCMDSTGGIFMRWNGFRSELTLKLLSGPTLAKSTRARFVYSDTIIYPIVINQIPNSGTYNLDNMPGGAYTYQLSDSCGQTLSGTFAITSVLNFTPPTYQVFLDCNGESNIHCWSMETPVLWLAYPAAYETMGYGSGYYYLSVWPGSYTLGVDYTSSYKLLPGVNQCWTILDNITIHPYNDSLIKATDVAECNGIIYIHVEIDSSNAIPPFQYEILGGPATFPPQISSDFTVDSFGTYLIGIIDGCGNVDTRQVTIDTGRFHPVVKSGGWCSGSRVQLSGVLSPYYSYIWKAPDGAVYTDNPHIINPVTSSDTGVYQITQVLDINGCRDSTYGTYHLVFKDTFEQRLTLCECDTLNVGNSRYTMSGSYYDDLTGSYGCDSVVHSVLTFLPRFSGHIIASDSVRCRQQQTITLTANGGTSYLWSPGSATDSFITVNPAFVTNYTVTVNYNGFCTSVGRITVYPSSEIVSNIMQTPATVCLGDSARLCTDYSNPFAWNTGDTTRCIVTSKPGNYSVTVVNLYGCVVTGHTTLSIFPQIPVTITPHGDTLFSNHFTGCQWYLNNVAIQGAAQFDFIAVQPGSYSLQVTDSNWKRRSN